MYLHPLDPVYDVLAQRATLRQSLYRRPGTLSNHRTAIRLLLKFCKAHGLDFKKVTPSNIVVFIERLTLTSSSPDTIMNYISYLRQSFKKLRLCNARFDDQLVLSALSAIKTSLRHEPEPSEPIPPELLRHIIQKLENDFINIPIVAFALLSFSTLLRQSSIAPRNANNFDPTRYICRRDLVQSQDGFVVSSKWAKNDQCSSRARHPKKLPIIPGSILCPTRALYRLLQYSPTLRPDQALITFKDGLVMPSSYIGRRWGETVDELGLRRRPLTLHCLRKAGTDFLMSVTNDENLVRTLGDWRSKQVRKYYRSKANDRANEAFATLSLLPKRCR